MTVLTIKPQGAPPYLIHDPGGKIGRKLRTGSPYESKLLDDIRRRQLTGSALDVGAHVGNHTLYLAAVCGLRVHAFEPNLQRFDDLVANLALNRGLRSWICAWPVALGARFGCGRWVDKGRMTLEPEEGSIDVRRYDSILFLPDLAVVKLDVEGMEALALEGMREQLERTHPVVYSEAHTEQARAAQEAVLRPLGFTQTGVIAMGSTMYRWEWQS